MRKPLMTIGALLSAGIISMGAGGVAIAQEAATTADGGAMAHPAHIHSGTCETLGEVVIPLNDVTSGPASAGTPTAASPVAASPMASPVAGPGAAIPVMASITTVDTPMDEILAAEHAINIHESAENIDTYIACGNVNAVPWDETSVLFGIAPLNNSGISGIGSLYDNGDGTTTVFIYVTRGIMTGGAMATPVASPAP